MRALPRKDVGSAAIMPVLAAVIMMVLKHDNVYDFQAVYGLILGLAVAGAGYFSPRNKSFVMLVAAPVATLFAAALGKILYGVEWDNAAVSVALAAFLAALFGYLAPAQNADRPPVVLVAPEAPIPPGAASSVRPRRP